MQRTERSGCDEASPVFITLVLLNSRNGRWARTLRDMWREGSGRASDTGWCRVLNNRIVVRGWAVALQGGIQGQEDRIFQEVFPHWHGGLIFHGLVFMFGKHRLFALVDGFSSIGEGRKTTK